MHDWWEAYFDRSFLEIYEPLLPPEEAEAEVDALAELLSMGPGTAVLDLGCGWGRHAVELSRRGCRVVGVDRSAVLLEEARGRAAAAGVEVEWRRCDVRELAFEAAFDVVLSLFSSLGYFGSDAEDLRVLEGARRALRPGGRFVLETMHRDLVAREFVEHDWWSGPDGRHVWVEREFDAVAGLSREWLRWRDGDGGTGEKYHEIRVRSATEWARLLQDAGLEPLVWYGDWELAPFALDAPKLIVVAAAR